MEENQLRLTCDWWRAFTCGTTIPRLHSTTAQTLTANDTITTRWQRSHLRYFDIFDISGGSRDVSSIVIHSRVSKINQGRVHCCTSHELSVHQVTPPTALPQERAADARADQSALLSHSSHGRTEQHTNASAVTMLLQSSRYFRSEHYTFSS